MPSKSRVSGIDLVRITGIVAVIAGHVWSDGPVRSATFSWHVPLFFFLAGYFTAPSDRPLHIEFEKRRRTLLTPYLAWLVVIGVVWLPVMLFTQQWSPLDLVRPVMGGQYATRPFSAFWFVTALFTAVMVRRLLQPLPLAFSWLVALLALGVATVVPDAVAALPLGIGSGVAALVFVLAGDAARPVLQRITHPALVGTTLVLLGMIAVACGSAPLDLKQADFGTPVIGVVVALTIAAGLTLLGIAADPLVSERFAAVTSILATTGLGVVLTHTVVLWLLAPLGEGRWWAFVVATVVPWVTMMALLSTRWAPALLGTPRSDTLRASRHRVTGQARPLPSTRARQGVRRRSIPLSQPGTGEPGGPAQPR